MADPGTSGILRARYAQVQNSHTPSRFCFSNRGRDLIKSTPPPDTAHEVQRFAPAFSGMDMSPGRSKNVLTLIFVLSEYYMVAGERIRSFFRMIFLSKTFPTHSLTSFLSSATARSCRRALQSPSMATVWRARSRCAGGYRSRCATTTQRANSFDF